MLELSKYFSSYEDPANHRIECQMNGMLRQKASILGIQSRVRSLQEGGMGKILVEA